MSDLSTQIGNPVIQLVLAGSPHAGKAAIAHHLAQQHEAPPLRSLALGGAHVVLGDFVWPEPLADGRFLTVELRTLYGAPDHRALPRLLMQGADGIVFLADTEPGRIGETPGHLREFLADANAAGVDWERVTVALQYHRIETCPGFRKEVMSHFLQLPEGQLECFATRADPGDDGGAAIEWVIRRIIQQSSLEQAAAG